MLIIGTIRSRLVILKNNHISGMLENRAQQKYENEYLANLIYFLLPYRGGV